MKQLSIKPTIYKYDTVEAFAKAFALCESDVIITNAYIFQSAIEKMHLPCKVLYQENYGTGEPTDEMVEAMYRDFPIASKRIFAVGGGTILDISKLFALRNVSPILELYDGKLPVEKARELILVPTTCGTGSEVTNIAILALVSRNTKKGLAHDSMYADSAVLIPELLKGLPFGVFATSSVDALIHGIESVLSPNATDYTKLFGYRAIAMILEGYQEVARCGKECIPNLMEKFLIASNYAGISFGNAGCAAVHAMSYPLGAKYHVPHGESNYAIFIGVMHAYMKLKPDGELAVLNSFLADILHCTPNEVYAELEKLMNTILKRKPLSQYGVLEQELVEFTDSVLENQGRLLRNNYTTLDREQILNIYQELFT